MEVMGRAAALAVTAVLCGAVVRRGAPEFALLLALGSGVCILLLSMDALEQVVRTIHDLAAAAQLEEDVLRPVVKTVALSLVTRLTGELCRSAGEGGVAAFVETTGTILALAAALPLAEGVLELMAQLLT
jgi:stage III sporulation protein AD